VPSQALCELQHGLSHILTEHLFCHQDERVMQLFGLVNTMLANDRVTAERDLSIARCVRYLAPFLSAVRRQDITQASHASARR